MKVRVRGVTSLSLTRVVHKRTLSLRSDETGDGTISTSPLRQHVQLHLVRVEAPRGSPAANPVFSMLVHGRRRAAHRCLRTRQPRKPGNELSAAALKTAWDKTAKRILACSCAPLARRSGRKVASGDGLSGLGLLLQPDHETYTELHVSRLNTTSFASVSCMGRYRRGFLTSSGARHGSHVE